MFGISCSVDIPDVVGKSRVKNSRAVRRQLTAGRALGGKGPRRPEEELTAVTKTKQGGRLQGGQTLLWL